MSKRKDRHETFLRWMRDHEQFQKDTNARLAKLEMFDRWWGKLVGSCSDEYLGKSFAGSRALADACSEMAGDLRRAKLADIEARPPAPEGYRFTGEWRPAKGYPDYKQDESWMTPDGEVRYGLSGKPVWILEDVPKPESLADKYKRQRDELYGMFYYTTAYGTGHDDGPLYWHIPTGHGAKDGVVQRRTSVLDEIRLESEPSELEYPRWFRRRPDVKGEGILWRFDDATTSTVFDADGQAGPAMWDDVGVCKRFGGIIEITAAQAKKILADAKQPEIHDAEKPGIKGVALCVTCEHSNRSISSAHDRTHCFAKKADVHYCFTSCPDYKRWGLEETA